MNQRATRISNETKQIIIDWYQRKKELGTTKALARRLGVSKYAAEQVIHRFRNPA